MQTTGQILGKAHRLCEWLRLGDASMIAGVTAISLVWATKEATKWHVGDVEDLPANSEDVMRLVPLRLPAKTMLIECATRVRMADGRTEPGTGFILCRDSDGSGIDCFAFMHLMDRFHFCGGGRLTKHTQDGLPQVAPFMVGRVPNNYADEVSTATAIVEMVLVLLSCTNVRSVENPPPAALNRKRLKAGKPPLFTYKTLHVVTGERSGTRSQLDDDDEARRSPRLHFRRGHVRRIGDGRITWVQQCMVGNRRLGMVEKVYSLES